MESVLVAAVVDCPWDFLHDGLCVEGLVGVPHGEDDEADDMVARAEFEKMALGKYAKTQMDLA